MKITSDAIALIDVIGEANDKKSKASISYILSKFGSTKKHIEACMDSLKKLDLVNYLVGTGSYHLTDKGKNLYQNTVDVEVVLTDYTRSKYFDDESSKWVKSNVAPTVELVGDVIALNMPYEDDAKLVEQIVGRGQVIFNEKLNECQYIISCRFGDTIYEFTPSSDVLVIRPRSILVDEMAQFLDEEISTKFMQEHKDFFINHKEHILQISNVSFNFNFSDLRKLS
ncbi:hypothetical protein Kuja_0720 [Vibrio phage vB_VchM_Kuja]|uniref:Uncharacterized protein n=1 Tax=Vibrio phage vB_VchM_Kuja TaxID=2686437 RepID=A0A6B9J947_9CAUD|nr:hypothetical protein HWC83_gp164 [Vibrio phage vB_VchM_Kuja]QGZ16063.1 hypothetical protein Kuja_0720 [Vibrio phage vB_VchM_Kuja]